jgi:hypothetical protein
MQGNTFSKPSTQGGCPMDSSMIGKIEKARRYATEARGRIVFDQFNATISGDNDSHRVVFDHGEWKCNCHYFVMHSWCSHTKAMEYLLEGMMPEAQAEPLPSAA